jgi:serine phosphatase RsbU (regulator of sigma subunit)
MIDPVKFKKILITILKLLIVVELVSALSQGLGQGQWQRFIIDIIIALVLYIMWDRMRILVQKKKHEYKRRMETSPENIKLREALIFSLLWSDEIYTDIPADRKRIVVISYTLIALGLVAADIRIGTGLMPLVIAGVLVLGAVNLLTWVVSLERSGREALEVELRLARDVQKSLLPVESPRIPGYDIAGMAIPATTVGGDFFDFMPSSDGKLGIAVADVSGKGLPASLLMANLQATLRSQIILNPPPNECLKRANQLLFQSTSVEKFATLFYAVLDVKNHVLDFCNAGHTPPLLLYDHAPVRRLDTGGVILGIVEDATYLHELVEVKEGSVLLICSDGVTEATDIDGEYFGEDRLIDVIQRNHSASSTEILQAVISAVNSYSSGSLQRDDMTLVVLKRVA